MLETEAGLRTWRLEPARDRTPEDAGPIAAMSLPLHRSLYLDYEGPVSGGRGEVRRWDAGEYHLLAEDAGQFLVRLSGSRLKGVATISRTPGSEAWSFQFKAAPS